MNLEFLGESRALVSGWVLCTIVLSRAVCLNLRGMAPGCWTWCRMAVLTVTVTVLEYSTISAMVAVATGTFPVDI